MGAVAEVYLPNGALYVDRPGIVWARSSTQIMVTELLVGWRRSRLLYTVRVRNVGGQLSNGVPLTLTDEVSVFPSSGLSGTQFSYMGRGFTGLSGRLHS